MNPQSNINQRELTLKQELTDLALTDREQFRSDAATSLRYFYRGDRRILTNIQTDTVNAYDFLAAWNDRLRPLRKQLESSRTDNRFHASIEKYLVVSKPELETKVGEIINDRVAETEKAFLDSHYVPNSRQRSRAKRLLQRSESNLDQLLTLLTKYILYKNIGKEFGIVIVDPYSSFMTRIYNHLRIRRERKSTMRSRRQRLTYIDRRQKELSHMNGGLLAAISEKGWDLATVISMRNHYDKLVAQQSKKQPVDAIKRLSIFEKVTSEFREDYVKNTASSKTSLEMTRQLSEDVDALLLRIFDLSNVQKNQLFIQSKEYRELIAERQEIVTAK